MGAVIVATRSVLASGVCVCWELSRVGWVLTRSLLLCFQSQLLLLNQYTVSMYYSTPRSAVEMPEMWTRMDWSCAKVINHVAMCCVFMYMWVSWEHVETVGLPFYIHVVHIGQLVRLFNDQHLILQGSIMW